jgi:hypothetical protein
MLVSEKLHMIVSRTDIYLISNRALNQMGNVYGNPQWFFWSQHHSTHLEAISLTPFQLATSQEWCILFTDGHVNFIQG